LGNFVGLNVEFLYIALDHNDVTWDGIKVGNSRKNLKYEIGKLEFFLEFFLFGEKNKKSWRYLNNKS
jgi:hypothetical protein